MVVFNVLVATFTIAFIVYFYFKWKFSYWKRKNVPYLSPKIPLGTSDNPLSIKVHLGIAFQTPYYEFKDKGYIHGGLYWFVKPVYMVVQPELIKAIILKDFQYFTDRGGYYNEKDDPLSFHLFNMDGAPWNKIRTKLTPTFTSGKMKMMFKMLVNVGDRLKVALSEYCTEEKPIDIKAVLQCYTTDVIGSTAFGLECDSFKNPTNDFRKYCLNFVHYSGIQSVKNAFAFSYPALSRRLGICLVPQHIRQFFLDIVKDTIDYRNKNNVTRNDFLNLLMELQKSKQNEQGLTVAEIAAQAFVFFIAGFETSSTTMSFCMYELARNQEIQKKLRNEISTILERLNYCIDYHAIMQMNYLQQVVDETLRKYPPLPYLTRRCVKNYNIPDINTTIDKGTTVVIPTYALHHDPEFYPDPEKFNPERFSSENKSKIPPCTFLPFGEGPRNCIGSRFGLLQVKVGLVILLLNFKFSLSDRTKTPLTFKSSGIFLNSVDNIWLNVETVNLDNI